MSALESTGPAVRARRSAIDHRAAMQLARTEYDRFADLLDALRPEDWGRPTDCADWDVRAVAGHCLGQVQLVASVWETRRQLRAAKRAGGEFLDSFTAHQVARNAALTPDELVGEYRRLIPAAVRGRRLMPPPVRGMKMGELQIVGDQTEYWTFGFLYDVIFTRDTWMHRIDIARAIGAAPILTAQHDGSLVADVVAEWTGRHDQPFDLLLTGVAGGRWRRGVAEPRELDAVDFCRILSGRGTAEGPLAVEVPF